VDVAMFDAALTFLSPAVCEHTVAGVEHRQYGNQAISRRPTANLFAVAGGHILLAVNNDKQFAALMRALGRSELLADPRFVDWDARGAHEAELRDIIEAALASADARTWEARLTAADVPCSAIWTIGEAVRHPQLAHRGVLQTVDSPHGPLTLVGPG